MFRCLVVVSRHGRVPLSAPLHFVESTYPHPVLRHIEMFEMTPHFKTIIFIAIFSSPGPSLGPNSPAVAGVAEPATGRK